MGNGHRLQGQICFAALEACVTSRTAIPYWVVLVRQEHPHSLVSNRTKYTGQDVGIEWVVKTG